VAQDDISWLLNQINCLRQSVGSPPLTMNVALSVAANRQAVNLANENLTNFHEGLDGSTPMTRVADAGYTGISVGENVASGREVSDPFNWWLNSPVHYDNMTNAHWKDIGIGIASGSQGTWYTLVFGATSWQITEFVSAPCTELDVYEAVPIENTIFQLSNTLDEDGEIETPNNDVPEPVESLPTPVILGLDENGYIQHVIQSGETPGTVMLSYGYSWDYLPTLMALNNMTEADARNLDVGDIFLIPLREGIFTPDLDDSSDDTLTPVPNEDQDTGLIIPVISDTPSAIVPPSSTPMPTLTTAPRTTAPQSPAASETLVPAVAFVASLTPTKTLVPTVAFAASLTPTLDTTGTPVTFAASATSLPLSAPVAPDSSNDKTPLLLAVAIILQIVILGVAAFEGVRRWRKRR